MVAANPMGHGSFTTPESGAALTAAQEKHRKCQSRRKELMRLIVGTGKLAIDFLDGPANSAALTTGL